MVYSVVQHQLWWAERKGFSVEVLDYLDGCNGLPPADVLKYVFEDGSWAAVRPSGTEPKLKIYYSVKGKNERAASARLMAFSDILLEATE